MGSEKTYDQMSADLFELIDNGMSEGEALKKVGYMYHKYVLRGEDKCISVKHLKEMYYGKTVQQS